ncbi:MAG TPA: diguanylate cyclase [Rhodocyclaceae bacterium]|nr:diguanylate cyclase [Rhodocyclaceae bacterium]
MVPLSTMFRRLARWAGRVAALVMLMAWASAIPAAADAAAGIVAGPAGFLADPAARASLADVRGRLAEFRPVPGAAGDFGFTDYAYWFHLHVENRNSVAATTHLAVRHATLDHLDFHAIYRDGRTVTLVAGDRMPSELRPYVSATPSFPFRLEAGESVELFLRARTEGGAMIVPLAILDEAGADRAMAAERTWHGFLLGLYAALFLFNFLVFVMFRETACLHFSLFLPFALLASTSLSGFLPTAFFDDGTWVANEGLVFFTGSAFLANLLFSREFLRVHQLGPRRRRLFNGLLAVGVLVAASPFLLPIRGAFATTALVLVLTPAMPIAVGARLRGGGIDTYLYVAGQLLGWLGLVGFGLAIYGVVPFVPLFVEGVATGIAVSAFLQGMALMERVRGLAVAKTRAEAMAAQALRDRKEELERLVAARTVELEKARIAAETLATTDALTGILNRRGVLDLAERELRLSRRYGTPLALVIFDLDRFKQINDRFGHGEGDRVLREVARMVADTVRSTDLFGRLGGEEFLLVLPGTPAEEAVALCERVRLGLARQVSAGQAGEPVTASFGVAATTGDDHDLDALQSAADRALYAAKDAGRNRVVLDEAPISSGVSARD